MNISLLEDITFCDILCSFCANGNKTRYITPTRYFGGIVTLKNVYDKLPN